MDDRSWMYRVSPEGLYMMDYYNGIEGFISCTLSCMRNISGGGIRCPCKRCKNKKVSRSRCCNNAFFTKRFHGEILVLVFLWDHGIGSTSSFSNVHGVVNDNSNPYRNIVIDAMRINQGYAGECSIVD